MKPSPYRLRWVISVAILLAALALLAYPTIVIRVRQPEMSDVQFFLVYWPWFLAGFLLESAGIYLLGGVRK